MKQDLHSLAPTLNIDVEGRLVSNFFFHQMFIEIETEITLSKNFLPKPISIPI